MLIVPASALADDAAAPMHFDLVAAGDDCSGCVIINASGEIGDDTSRDFAAFVAQNRLDGILPQEPRTGEILPATAPKVIVAFESIGGKVQSALIIGRRIRKAGWITVVGQGRISNGKPVFRDAGCYSACTMVMLGGASRFVIPGSKVGVHQFSPQFGDGETFNAQEMNLIVREYGREVVSVYDFVHAMDVNEEFFLSTLRTPFNSLDVLPSSQWVSTGVATAMLPDTNGEVPVSVILDAAGHSDLTASIPHSTSVAEIPAVPVQPQQTAAPHVTPVAVPTVPTGGWTVARAAGLPAAALFADGNLRVSLACSDKKTARLELAFKDLAPLDLEQMRAAASSARMMKFGDHQISIESVASPEPGEQSVAALLDIKDVRTLPNTDTLTFAVLNKAGEPVGKAGTVPTAGVAKAIFDALATCGA